MIPGGKVFVFSGLLPIARNENGLAAVLGHEIAHNLAGHVGERMSGEIGINILLYSLIFLTGGIAILGTHFIGGAILDLLFSRPMGRKQESEADYIGLMMMAEACFDPREALGFWMRMEQAQQGEPPEWISTHPSVGRPNFLTRFKGSLLAELQPRTKDQRMDAKSCGKDARKQLPGNISIC